MQEESRCNIPDNSRPDAASLRGSTGASHWRGAGGADGIFFWPSFFLDSLLSECSINISCFLLPTLEKERLLRYTVNFAVAIAGGCTKQLTDINQTTTKHKTLYIFLEGEEKKNFSKCQEMLFARLGQYVSVHCTKTSHIVSCALLSLLCPS